MPSAQGQPGFDATDAPDELERPIGEECGVFGVWAPGEDVAKLTY
ncbi:MAG: amidophosphoribosyltransferase, partial [Frankiales bacterium]|nr:amidophosphoribosyltransferase [Frankiales bacterium]